MVDIFLMKVDSAGKSTLLKMLAKVMSPDSKATTQILSIIRRNSGNTRKSGAIEQNKVKNKDN